MANDIDRNKTRRNRQRSGIRLRNIPRSGNFAPHRHRADIRQRRRFFRPLTGRIRSPQRTGRIPKRHIFYAFIHRNADPVRSTIILRIVIGKRNIAIGKRDIATDNLRISKHQSRRHMTNNSKAIPHSSIFIPCIICGLSRCQVCHAETARTSIFIHSPTTTTKNTIRTRRFIFRIDTCTQSIKNPFTNITKHIIQAPII